jgi:glycosyltransferase involved in cell wall biosynthesis
VTDAPRPQLSIVIPAYNEADRIVPSLQKIERWLASSPLSTEVVVANDGSTDATADLVRSYAKDHPWVRLETYPHRGKGHAVKQGMLAATGELRFLADADLSMPIELLDGFLPVAAAGTDVVIGSREAPGARRIGEPSSRHINGRLANFIIRVIAGLDIDDTQCGFKLFSAPVAERLFGLQTQDGFGFDIEILFLAHKFGYRMVEHPIDWYYMPQSKVRPIRDNVRTLREALNVRLNDWRGVYR